MLEYPIRLKKDGRTFLATSPDFPELTTFGEGVGDALIHALDALEEAIAARIAGREDLPEPSRRGKYSVALPTQVVLKVLLYQGMRRRGLTKAQLARRLNWHGPQVDRLLDLRHASRLDQIDTAFNALGQKIVIDVREKPVVERTKLPTVRRGRSANRGR